MSNRIYVALDTPDLERAKALAGRVRHHVGGLKLGLEFFAAHGAHGVREMSHLGLPIFLDLKLHDIPNTAAGGIRAVADLAPTYITVHTAGGAEMMRAAAAEARAQATRLGVARPKLLGVTVLTSLDTADLAAMGVPAAPSDQVRRLAALARANDLDGVICSPLEIAALRADLGSDFVLMVPGIRPAGSAANDQKRVMTPGEAVRLGASHLVVSRPIAQAADPRQAALAIAREAGVNLP